MVRRQRSSIPNSSRPGELNERAQQLLKVLIERYIRDGQPVGSRTLSRESGLDLSPASIRNVMSDLEELGLVTAPHTSAGRVPTVQGYRLFVDSLLTVRPLNTIEVRKLEQELAPADEPQRILETASSLLSEITEMAGVVLLPRRERMTLRHVDFLPLSGQRVLVVLVINEQEVQNRIIHTSRPYTQSELQQAANYLNERYGSQDLTAVRERLFREMQAAQQDMTDMMGAAVEMARHAFAGEDAEEEGDYLLSGQTKLMGYAEMADIDKLRQLFEAFNTKRDLLHLLDESLDAQGMQIFIGEESGYKVLDDCSVVTSPYRVEGEVLGVLGVIGPTRMAYDRVIPIVDITARLLGAALNQAK